MAVLEVTEPLLTRFSLFDPLNLVLKKRVQVIRLDKSRQPKKPGFVGFCYHLHAQKAEIRELLGSLKLRKAKT